MKGTGIALITPFKEDYSIDYNALANIVELCISGGVEYLVALGTTGEGITLNADEKKKVYQFIAEQTKGRVELVAGIGGNNTQEVCSYLSTFDFSKYSAILSVSPYYNKPNQEGIYLHYEQILKRSPVPVILYNVPGRTGSNMSVETTLRLANYSSKCIAIKEACGNMEQSMDLISNAPKGFSIISGDDNLTLPYVSVGMSGVISVIGQAYPVEFSNMVRAALAGQMDEAQKLHYKLYPLMKSIYLDGNPGGIKALLSMKGVCKNVLRLPLSPVKKDVYERIHSQMF